MKRWIGIPGGLILAILWAPAYAQEAPRSDGGLYLSVHAIGSNPGAKNDPDSTIYDMEYAYGGTAAIGYVVAAPDRGGDVRFELETSYRTNEIGGIDTTKSLTLCGGLPFCDASGEINIAAAMVNVFIDFHTQTAFVPHIGVGYGRARYYFQDWVIDGVAFPNETVDTDIYQFMGGIGYRISPGLILDTEYRFVQANNNSLDGFTSKELTIGLRLIM